jgi:hypothetical protein
MNAPKPNLNIGEVVRMPGPERGQMGVFRVVDVGQDKVVMRLLRIEDAKPE